jgi:prenylcysteine oxidase / farnesylcysteine lyase
MLRPLALAVTLSPALAFQLPWNIPFFSTDSHQAPLEVPLPPELDIEIVSVPDVPTTPRVAVIGAGAGGSSAAFWLSKAKERFNLDFEIDVYEKEDYIGGREYTTRFHVCSWTCMVTRE